MAKKISEAYLEIKDNLCITFDGLIKDVATIEKEIRPLSSKDWLSVSQLPYLCPRMEAICLLDNYTRTDVINDTLRLIFETGNAFQDILRMMIAPKGVLFGMWNCKKCDYVHGSTDGEFTVNERGAKEAILLKRISMPSKCDVMIDGYGVCGGEEFEYIEETIVDEVLRVKGHPDGYISNSIYDDVLEIKTVNDNRYKMAKQNPFPEHIEQVMWYAWKTNKKSVLITYFNKNGGAYYTHRLDLTNQVISNMISRVRETWRVVHEFERTGKIEVLPDRLCIAIKDQRAKSCEVCDRCFSFGL